MPLRKELPILRADPHPDLIQLQPARIQRKQRVRSAIHVSRQLTSPVASYLWSLFRRRFARYYQYQSAM